MRRSNIAAPNLARCSSRNAKRFCVFCQRAPNTTATRPSVAMKRSALHTFSSLGRMLTAPVAQAANDNQAGPVTFEGERPYLRRFAPSHGSATRKP